MWWHIICEGGSAFAIAMFLWPSEAASVSLAASSCSLLLTASRSFLASQPMRRQLLTLVSSVTGAPTGEAVLAKALDRTVPWPKWQDGLMILQHCGVAVHEERRAMQIALRSGPVKAVKWLLRARADAEKPVEADLTPLRLAARFGNDEVVDTLLESRAQANTRGRFGYTALMVAAMYGHADIVQLLLSRGAQVNTNGDGETAIDLASRYPEVAEMLQAHVDAYGWTGSADEVVCALVILANGIYICIHSDWKMMNAYQVATHEAQKHIDVHPADFFFASWFVMEMMIRILPDGPCHFFCLAEESGWNTFDALITLEAVVGLIIRSSTSSFSYLRVLGIFRLARLVKHMQRPKELRKLKKTLLVLCASLVDLFWAFVVVSLILCIYSIFLSTATVGYFETLPFNETSSQTAKEVQEYFGSIPATMLSLWAAISGGNDSNGFYFATFIVFTAFCTIGFFNVVTGIFVDSALASANAFRSRDDVIADHEDQKSEEKKDRKELRAMLMGDAGDDKVLSEGELERHLNKPQSEAFWKRMHLETGQVRELYKLYQQQLHIDGKPDSRVKVKEFLHFTRTSKDQASCVNLLRLDHFIRKQFKELQDRLPDTPAGNSNL
ncbi:unnamed protein product [Durusdinium trenchii]|uniref:Ion transport domain-containing protein n=1 Tax=Durusdinium trenchii TaxID=1381693 RepID=A0ABP0R5F2_9DINO